MRIQKQLEQAKSERDVQVFTLSVEVAAARLQQARDGQARFNSNPQRFVDQHRPLLVEHIAKCIEEILACRRSLGMQPPMEHEGHPEPSSPATPTSCATSRRTSGVHKRQPVPYVT